MFRENRSRLRGLLASPAGRRPLPVTLPHPPRPLSRHKSRVGSLKSHIFSQKKKLTSSSSFWFTLEEILMGVGFFKASIPVGSRLWSRRKIRGKISNSHRLGEDRPAVDLGNIPDQGLSKDEKRRLRCGRGCKTLYNFRYRTIFRNSNV